MVNPRARAVAKPLSAVPRANVPDLESALDRAKAGRGSARADVKARGNQRADRERAPLVAGRDPVRAAHADPEKPVDAKSADERLY